MMSHDVPRNHGGVRGHRPLHKHRLRSQRHVWTYLPCAGAQRRARLELKGWGLRMSGNGFWKIHHQRASVNGRSIVNGLLSCISCIFAMFDYQKVMSLSYQRHIHKLRCKKNDDQPSKWDGTCFEANLCKSPLSFPRPYWSIVIKHSWHSVCGKHGKGDVMHVRNLS